MKFLEHLSALIKTVTVYFHLYTLNQEVKCLIKSQLILRNNTPKKHTNLAQNSKSLPVFTVRKNDINNCGQTNYLK